MAEAESRSKAILRLACDLPGTATGSDVQNVLRALGPRSIFPESLGGRRGCRNDVSDVWHETTRNDASMFEQQRLREVLTFLDFCVRPAKTMED